MRVLMAQPRGFCAGVVRAIEIVERSLEKFGAPVYVRHEIVHNRHVVEKLERMGAVFVETLDEIPDGAVTIFSAHGVAQSIIDEAKSRGLPVLDATLPSGLEGPHPGQAVRGARSPSDPDRPCRPSRGRGDHRPGWRAGPISSPRPRMSRDSNFPTTRLSPT